MMLCVRWEWGARGGEDGKAEVEVKVEGEKRGEGG